MSMFPSRRYERVVISFGRKGEWTSGGAIGVDIFIRPRWSHLSGGRSSFLRVVMAHLITSLRSLEDFKLSSLEDLNPRICPPFLLSRSVVA